MRTLWSGSQIFIVLLLRPSSSGVCLQAVHFWRTRKPAIQKVIHIYSAYMTPWAMTFYKCCVNKHKNIPNRAGVVILAAPPANWFPWYSFRSSRWDSHGYRHQELDLASLTENVVYGLNQLLFLHTLKLEISAHTNNGFILCILLLTQLSAFATVLSDVTAKVKAKWAVLNAGWTCRCLSLVKAKLPTANTININIHRQFLALMKFSQIYRLLVSHVSANFLSGSFRRRQTPTSHLFSITRQKRMVSGNLRVRTVRQNHQN